MSKIEFQLENICEFCCMKLWPDHDVKDHFCKNAEININRSVPRNNDSQCRLTEELDKKEEKLSTYYCTECSEVFPNFEERNNHCVILHCSNSNEKNGGRMEQTLATQTNSELNEHVLDFVKSEESRHICTHCSKSFSNKRNLSQHVRIAHICSLDNDQNKSSFRHICPNCGKRFYKKANLKSHLLKYTSERSLECPVEGCNNRFKREKALRVHQATKHEPYKNDPHLCSFCGKRFATQSGLKNHIGKHTGVDYVKRKFICSTCSKSFRCKADLSTHSVVHTKEKPFSCSLCAATFTQRASLKDHQNVHDNKFQCPSCNKSFGRRRYLLQHQSSLSLIHISEPTRRYAIS